MPETITRGASAWESGLVGGGVGDHLLDRAAFLVEAVEFGGDGARFLGVGCGQQAHAEVGLADPAAGIDPRPKREPEVAAGRAFDQARGVGEGGEADVAALGHHLEPLGDEGAVEGLQFGDVGDRAERDNVDQVEDLGLRRRR